MRKNVEMAKVGGLLVMALFFSSAALFAGPSVANKKIKLTKEQIAKCVKTIPAFYKVFNDKKQKMLRAKKSMSPVAAFQALLPDDQPGFDAKVKKFAAENGYSGEDEFLRSLSGVMMSFAYLKIVAGKERIAKKLKRLPPQMAAMFKPRLDAMENFKKRCEKRLAPETIAAVKPYLGLISAALAPAEKSKCCP